MSLSNSKLLSNNIFSNLLFASLYIATFAYVWKTYCVPVWHAYFYYDVPHSEFYEAIGYLVALVPVLFTEELKCIILDMPFPLLFWICTNCARFVV